jgi:hypothetical protein
MQSQPVIDSSHQESMRFASSKFLKIETAALARKPNDSATRVTLSFDFQALVEVNGIEPMTSCLQSRRSPN